MPRLGLGWGERSAAKKGRIRLHMFYRTHSALLHRDSARKIRRRMLMVGLIAHVMLAQ
jgi:hypothetical protein